MAIFSGSAEHAASVLHKGIEYEFKHLLEMKLKETLDALVKEAAREASRNMMMQVQSYKMYDKDRTEVRIIFNNKDIT